VANDLFVSYDSDREPGDRLAPEVVDEICLISGSDECGGGGGGADGAEMKANKGQINGYAALDGSARLPAAQLPLPALEYKGTWNASSNTPTLSNGSGNLGDIWRVSTAGNDLGFPVEVGDVIFYDGNAWYKLGGGSGSGGDYTLPVATATVLGGVKQGTGVTIAADGTLTATVNSTTLASYQLKAEKGVNNGYASLDASGKLPSSQLPLSALEYKGTWNAATNTPPLAAGVGTQGDMWRVTVTGTQFGVKFTAGDFALFNGTSWETATSGTAGVSTVAGLTGDVAAAPLKTALALDQVDNTADAAKNVLSATQLTTPRLLNGVPFDGTVDITIPVDQATDALYERVSSKGQPDGYVPLDDRSMIPAQFLPARVETMAELTDVTPVGLSVGTAVDATAARNAIEAVSDFDPRLDDNRMPIDGSVTTQKLEASIATTVGALQSPYFGTSTTGVLNADNGTNLTLKKTAFGVRPYTLTEKPFYGIQMNADTSANLLRLGGGSTVGRAATQIEFYTAANNTTDTGTRWARITGTGDTFFYGVQLTVGDAAATVTQQVVVNSGPTSSCDLTWATGSLGRWSLRADATPETGGDAGSDLVLLPRTDAGVPKPEVMRFARATGAVKFSTATEFAGTVTMGGSVTASYLTLNQPANGGLWLSAPTGDASKIYAKGGTGVLYLDASAGVQINGVPVVTTTSVSSMSNKTLLDPTIAATSGSTACKFTAAITTGNYVQITGTATGSGFVVIAPAGSDTNCNMSFNPRGAGLLTTRVDAAISPTGVEIASARVGVKVDAPPLKNSPGQPGQFAVGTDGTSYWLYICVAASVWMRSAALSNNF
jgi:hypothetical protein